MCFTCGLVHGYLVAPLRVKRFAVQETGREGVLGCMGRDGGPAGKEGGFDGSTEDVRGCSSKRRNGVVSGLQRPPISKAKTTSLHLLERRSSGYVSLHWSVRRNRG